jgi:hypothetical protein
MRLPVILFGAGLLAACATSRQHPVATSSSTPGSARTNLNVIVTPGHATTGRVAAVNAAGRFVILTFPLGAMPAPDKRLNVYREGLKVAEIKVSGQPLDINTAADIVAGECRVGDEVREE